MEIPRVNLDTGKLKRTTKQASKHIPAFQQNNTLSDIRKHWIQKYCHFFFSPINMQKARPCAYQKLTFRGFVCYPACDLVKSGVILTKFKYHILRLKTRRFWKQAKAAHETASEFGSPRVTEHLRVKSYNTQGCNAGRIKGSF
jgi:hypothetical protein